MMLTESCLAFLRYVGAVFWRGQNTCDGSNKQATGA